MPAWSTNRRGDLIAGPLRSRGASSPRSAAGLVRNRDEKLASARDLARSTRPPRITPSAPKAEGATRRRRGIADRITLPVADALKRERDSFLELVAGDQSKAQRHIFFAEREAAKVPTSPASRLTRSEGGRDRRRHHGAHCMCFANRAFR